MGTEPRYRDRSNVIRLIDDLSPDMGTDPNGTKIRLFWSDSSPRRG